MDNNVEAMYLCIFSCISVMCFLFIRYFGNRSMHIRDHIEMHLSIEDAEKFALWAFGDEFRTIDLQHEGYIYWNKLHGEDLLLKCDGRPIDDIPKMIKLWKDIEVRMRNNEL